jgi:membrane-associated phospholipid phosphatase
MIVTLILVGYIIFDLFFWDELYDSSLDLTKFFRSIPIDTPSDYEPGDKPFRNGYAYTFSNIMYKWAPVILPVAIIVHPRKSVGLSYILLYFYNSTIRLLLMQTYRDRRPTWDMDFSDIPCKCGFGKPSGHSSNSTMIYCIIFYEFWWRFPNRRKGCSLFASLALFYWIIGSILWSRIYYARHTYSHVILGHFYAMSLFLAYF